MLKIASILFCLAAFLSCGLASPTSSREGALSVRAIPLELNPRNAAETRLGDLTFVSGFELSSSDPRFGGLSGLSIEQDGSVLYAVSDHGYWISARLLHSPSGALTGFESWDIGPLLTPEGEPVSGALTDAEALSRDRDGSFVVAFEQLHRLWRYPSPPAAFRSAARVIAIPADIAKAPANGGMEAVTVLPDGRLLIITEQYKNPDGSLKGWLIDRGDFSEVSYVGSPGYRPTDITAMANGDVLLLETTLTWAYSWSCRIVRLARESLSPGARVRGEKIAQIDPPRAVDNFEGIAVREGPNSSLFVYLVSDDNYHPLERTILLQFRLDTPSR